MNVTGLLDKVKGLQRQGANTTTCAPFCTACAACAACPVISSDTCTSFCPAIDATSCASLINPTNCVNDYTKLFLSPFDTPNAPTAAIIPYGPGRNVGTPRSGPCVSGVLERHLRHIRPQVCVPVDLGQWLEIFGPYHDVIALV